MYSVVDHYSFVDYPHLDITTGFFPVSNYIPSHEKEMKNTLKDYGIPIGLIMHHFQNKDDDFLFKRILNGSKRGGNKHKTHETDYLPEIKWTELMKPIEKRNNRGTRKQRG